MMEIIDKILDQLTGIDRWIAAITLIIVLARWWYVTKTKKAEQKIAKRQIAFAVVMTVIAVLVFAVNRLFFSPNYTFPKDVAGILVLRIEGDDERNSLQRDLASSLNTELSKEAPEQKIEVRAHDKIVTEGMGSSQAHAKARKIGKDSKALLVIWGNRVDQKKFHPRLTVVDDQPRTVMAGERALAAQSLSEISLPAEIVNQPIFLTHFAAGYSFYDRHNYADALMHFESSLKRPVINSIELTGLRFYAGTSHWHLAHGQKEMASHLRYAIAYYDTVLLGCTEKEFPAQWARTQNNLGVAYVELPIGDRSANLHKAIIAYEAALRVWTEKDYPVDWATTQNNLGDVYREMPIGDRSLNLRKAFTAFEAALRIFTEEDFPLDWAMIQNNLGNVYSDLIKDDPSENFPKAIGAHNAAMRVYTETDYPVEWARSQNNLAIVYAKLSTGDRSENIRKAIAASEAAMRVYTENDFPVEWARSQAILGIVAYKTFLISKDSDDLEKAIKCFQNALRIWKPEDFPYYNQSIFKIFKDALSEFQNLMKK